MVDLTVVVITKNEEKNIKKCLESFRGIVKRFVVIDSGSEDDTIEVAKALGADTYYRKFTTHAEQKNWGFSNTNISTKWIMSIDADEELTQELCDEITKKLPTLDDNVKGIVLKRRLYFLGRWIKHGGKYPENHLRIFQKGCAEFEERIMDEHMILLKGETVIFNYDFIDNNNKSLSWWINKHNWYSDREMDDFYNDAEENDMVLSKQAKIKRKIKMNGYYKFPKFMRAHLYFIYRYYLRLGFLDGKSGLIFHFLQAYWYRFLVDSKMYEREIDK